MTKKTRKILFSIFIIMFVFIAPTLIFYFQGYRFDFENKKLTQTGGLFLKTTPKQTQIYLDGKFIKKTDFFFGSAFIENLLPKKYKVTVKKQGYWDWEKGLEIKEKEVTEAKNIILFPKNIDFSLLSKGVERFWFSPDRRGIILETKENSLSENNESWSLKLFDLNKNLKIHLIQEDDISRTGAELFDLSFSKDNPKEVILEIGTKEQLKNFSLKFDKIPPTLTEIKPLQLKENENIITSQRINNDVYYLDKHGNIFKTDASFSKEEKITSIPFPIKIETDYRLRIFGDYIFLQEGKSLYQFKKDTELFENFFDGLKDLKISPDKNKLVYFSDSEIWLFFLKENKNPPKMKAGDRIFLIRFLEKIKDVSWLNSNYLILNAGDKIKIAEIDNRDKINIVDLVEFKNPEIFFNENNKSLYILSQNNLFQSSPLLP